MREKPTPLALSILGAASATSLSESTIDAVIRAGILPVRRYGNRTLILIRDLERWLESLPVGRPNAPRQLEGNRTGRPRKNCFIRDGLTMNSNENQRQFSAQFLNIEESLFPWNTKKQ